MCEEPPRRAIRDSYLIHIVGSSIMACRRSSRPAAVFGAPFGAMLEWVETTPSARMKGAMNDLLTRYRARARRPVCRETRPWSATTLPSCAGGQANANVRPGARMRRPWQFNFLEHFSSADVRGSRDRAGMETKIAEASVAGELRPALWEHPPVRGEAVVEYHVPVPAGLKNLRLRAAIGVRDGAQPTPRATGRLPHPRGRLAGVEPRRLAGALGAHRGRLALPGRQYHAPGFRHRWIGRPPICLGGLGRARAGRSPGRELRRPSPRRSAAAPFPGRCLASWKLDTSIRGRSVDTAPIPADRPR